MFHHVGLVAQVLRFMKSFSLSAIPSSRLASSIANVGVENCGINQRGTSQNVSHSPGHANPHFAHFQTLFFLPLSAISVCHKNDFDVQILTAICCNQCVWQRKQYWRRHWCLLWKIKYRMMGKSCNIFSRGICWHQEGEGDQQTTNYFPKLSTIAILFRKWFQQQKTIHVLSLYNLSKPTYQETLYTTGFQFTFEVPPTLEYIWLLTI